MDLPTYSHAVPKKIHVPFGMLSSDRTGYTSFDLSAFGAESVITALYEDQVIYATSVINVRVVEFLAAGLRRLWVLLFADSDLCILVSNCQVVKKLI